MMKWDNDPGSTSAEPTNDVITAYKDSIDLPVLIREVKNRPVLYDPKAKDYKCKEFKEKMWAEVYEAIFRDWPQLSPSEQQDVGRLVQRKWKSVRFCFLRDLQIMRGASRNGMRKKRKYLYFDQLLFLANVISDQAVPKGLHDMTSSGNCEEMIEGSHEESPFEGTPSKLLMPSRVPSPLKKPKKVASPEDHPPIGTTSVKVEEDMDEDKLFLMSLVPTLRKFSENQKFLAKIEILQVIRRVQQISEAGGEEPSSSGIVTDVLSETFHQLTKDVTIIDS